MSAIHTGSNVAIPAAILVEWLQKAIWPGSSRKFSWVKACRSMRLLL